MKISTEPSKPYLLSRLQCLLDTAGEYDDALIDLLERKQNCCDNTILYPYFYGAVDGATRPVAGSALADLLTRADNPSINNIIVGFFSTDAQWLVLAVHSSYTVKTKWNGDIPENAGVIGGPPGIGGNLFPQAEPALITIDELVDEPYNFYISSYPSAATQLIFKNS